MKRLTLALTLSLPLLASQAQAGAVLHVAEASAYTLVYSLAIPNIARFNVNAIPYTVDNHASIATGSFTRIAYYMELQRAGGPLMYAYASMNAFTNDASKIGVPSTPSGAFFKQNVNNMNVFSNVAGIVTGNGIGTGNIEFWHFYYGTSNGAGVAGASNNTYDFGDQPGSSGDLGYGSMQIHNYSAGQTILAYNNWGSNGTVSDVGLGNQVGGSGNPDWTYAYNATNYTIKNLEVLVLKQSSIPEPGSLALLGFGLLGLAAVRRKAARPAIVAT